MTADPAPSANSITWAWDLRTNLVDDAAPICRFLRVPPTSHLRPSYLFSWMPDAAERDAMRRATNQLLVGAQPAAVRFRICDGEGESRHLICRGRVDSSNHTRVVGDFYDVTTRVHELLANCCEAPGLARVGLVADDPLARFGMKALLSHARSLNVVAEITMGDLASGAPPVDVLFVQFSDPSEVELIERYAASEALPPRIVAHFDRRTARVLRSRPESRVDALLAGQLSPDDVAHAIASVLSGHRFMSDQASALVAAPDGDNDDPELAEAEVQILSMIASGLHNHEIARQCFISVPTVKRRLQVIYEKLGARDRAHAVLLASRRGAISVGD